MQMLPLLWLTEGVGGLNICKQLLNGKVGAPLEKTLRDLKDKLLLGCSDEFSDEFAGSLCRVYYYSNFPTDQNVYLICDLLTLKTKTEFKFYENSLFEQEDHRKSRFLHKY